MYVSQEFRPFIEHDLESLIGSESTIYGLFNDLTVGFTNLAWDRFASENDGRLMGFPYPEPRVLQAITGELRPFYEDMFRRVLDSRRPADHEYSCPSRTLHRQFRMRVLPAGEGLIVIHHLIVEEPHPAGLQAHPPAVTRYHNDKGWITQCAHCRMVRRPDSPQTWDWVPAFLDTPPAGLTFGLCYRCFAHYYPHLATVYQSGLSAHGFPHHE